MYAGLIITAVGVLLLVSTMYLVHRLVAISTDPLVVLPYQSGWPPVEHALSRYHVRWYLATLLFLALMASLPGPAAGCAINVAWYAAERVRSCVTGAFELCGWCCLCTFTSRRASLPLPSPAPRCDPH